LDKTTQKINTAAANSTVPKIQIPGYKIERKLGHGGMAHVYLAIQESFGREVALKILSPHLADDDQFSKRFLREARIVSQLNHPNIVTVFDAGKFGQHHYMSMEYIPGKDLKQLKDSISREEAIRIVKDVASALDFAGKKGIVHRDVKPENIMIQQHDKRVVLMDFGIAYGDDVTQGMTQTGKAIGTPHFMSPEQTKGLKVDHRSDIYSLGVVLFQLLAGHLPFDADSAVAVGIKHLTAPIPLLPGGLEIFQPIVNRCLSKEPKHRYQKAAELITALEQISGDQLEKINTQAVIFKDAGADRDAETQISEVPLSKKRKVPDLVFPSSNRKTIDDSSVELKVPSNRRRNLLILLLIATAAYGANEKQKELSHFWGDKALPTIVKKFPNLFPQSYIQYWAKRREDEKPKKISTPVVNAAVPVTPATTTEQNIDSQPALDSTEKLSQNEVTLNTQPIPIPAHPLTQEEKLSFLKEGLDKIPENAIELATIYKERLIIDKKDSIARKGLSELREWTIQQIQLAFATDDSVLARQYINTIKQSFPRAAKNKRFVRLERKVALLEKINSHFERAKKYFHAGALSKPINKNALNEINTILELSPNNDDAKKFLEKIADSYLKKTTQLQEQGNIHNAILMVEEGIAALNNNTKLINKRKQLKDTIKHNNAITSLFKKAKKYQDADQLIRPQAYNAYDIYKQVLEKESNNLQAKAGLKTIHQLLAKKITAAIHKGNLKISEEYLQAAIQRYGRSPLLANVQLKLNDALDAIAPKIETIKLSPTAITRLRTNIAETSNIQTLQLKHTLYIGFNFINFDPTTTWLEATLFDKSKSIKIAQKPVIISSQFGEHFFDMTLPTQGFKNHQYKIEIKLKNRVLASKSFLVRN